MFLLGVLLGLFFLFLFFAFLFYRLMCLRENSTSNIVMHDDGCPSDSKLPCNPLQGKNYAYFQV